MKALKANLEVTVTEEDWRKAVLAVSPRSRVKSLYAEACPIAQALIREVNEGRSFTVTGGRVLIDGSTYYYADEWPARAVIDGFDGPLMPTPRRRIKPKGLKAGILVRLRERVF